MSMQKHSSSNVGLTIKIADIDFEAHIRAERRLQEEGLACLIKGDIEGARRVQRKLRMLDKFSCISGRKIDT